jgi:N,N'-diacetyllegionaminate synthase
MPKVQVIAEIGNTHEGSLGLAKCFLKAAAECGVDAVKLQTHIFEAESLPNAPNPPYFKDESRKQYFERTSFNLEQYRTLKKYAEEELGVEFLSSPFSLEAIDFLEELGVRTYKIPSGEVNNLPLLEKVAATGKRVLLSSGMSSWKELDEAVGVFRDAGAKAWEGLVLLQCTSEYPCPPEQAGLNVMLEMRQRYGLPVGFSDHTLGIAVPLAATVLGAVVVEKHFTLSKKMYGSDAKNSTEPEEFRMLVQGIRDAEKAVASTVAKDEKVKSLGQMKMTFEKSIVSARSLEAGTTIAKEHLAYKKPGDGIPAREYGSLIGRRLARPVGKDHKFVPGDFSEQPSLSNRQS